MKNWKKALVSVLTGCLVLGAVPVKAAASEPAQPGQPAADDGYTYTLTLSAGDKGLIDGKKKVVIDGLELGDQINLFQDFYGDIVLNE